jgi:hypothetical protein
MNTRKSGANENLLWRPSDVAFCASGAHVPKSTLRSGFQKPHQLIHQTKFLHRA